MRFRGKAADARRAGRLLASTTPSPGEIRKILLARGVERGPHFIVMDEPTNHLDLPSIECLENALAEAPCALLLVSHDERFLARLTVRRWQLTQSGNTVRCLESHPKVALMEAPGC